MPAHAASQGVRNARGKVETTDAAPWSSWPKSSLVARAIRWIGTFCIPAKGFGAGEPLVVARWQADWLEEVLAPGVSSSALTLARGNGKSTWTGAVATWAVFDERLAVEFGGKPDIPIVAPSLKQARKACYGAAVDFRKGHPELAARSLQYTASGEERIVVPGNLDGELYPVTGSDVDRLQGLDPTVALVDEIGFIKVDAWDALLLAGGKRPRSLILGLGTRNPADEPNALDHLLGQLELQGRIDGFVLLDFHADPDCAIDDRDQWRKANPALAEGYMREDALENARKLSPAASFRCFKLNQKPGKIDGWLGVEGPTVWDETEGAVELDPALPVHVGVDKSAYNDCSAVVAIQWDGARWRVDHRVFLPDGGRIDHNDVRNHLRALYAVGNVAAVGYDDRYFVEGAQELADEGLPMVKVPQTAQRLVPAFSNLFADIIGRRIVHRADPVFRSHVLGAVPKLDQSGGFMLAKGRSKVHIDGAVAWGIARAVSDVELPVERTAEDFYIG